MKKIKELIVKCWRNDVLRYIFFGVCTTLVNQICFYGLRFTVLSQESQRTAANFIAVALAIVFAYFVNSMFVFESKARGFVAKCREFAMFAGARVSTLIIEVGGVWILVDKLKMNEFLIKTILIQIIVLVLNYVFSKFIVFTKKSKEQEKEASEEL